MVLFIVLTLLVIVGLGLLLFMWMEAKQNNVTETLLKFDNFPASFKAITIFFISDIHKRELSSTLLTQIGQPDIVVIGGDLCEKGVPFARIKDNIKKLTEIAPTYFVWGNNDYEVDYHELDSLLLDCGVKILDNTAVEFESAIGEKLALLGIDDMKYDRHRLDLALSDVSDDVKFKILISHNPEIISEITKENEIDFVISGHTHGGQIRILNFGLYKKGGVERLENTTILISNGYGTTKFPLRLGAPPETNLITIISND